MALATFSDARRVYETEFQSELHQKLRGQANDSAIDGLRKNCVIPGPQQAEYRVNRGHSGSENECRRAAFQFRDGTFQSAAIGMRSARVVETLVFPKFSLDVGRGLVDRRYD